MFNKKTKMQSENNSEPVFEAQIERMENKRLDSGLSENVEQVSPYIFLLEHNKDLTPAELQDLSVILGKVYERLKRVDVTGEQYDPLDDDSLVKQDAYNHLSDHNKQLIEEFITLMRQELLRQKAVTAASHFVMGLPNPEPRPESRDDVHAAIVEHLDIVNKTKQDS